MAGGVGWRECGYQDLHLTGNIHTHSVAVYSACVRAPVCTNTALEYVDA